MEISLTMLFVFLIAALCGAIGQALTSGEKGGLLSSVVIGLIGAVVGPLLAAQLRLAEPYVLNVGGGESVPLVWSIVGAALFVTLLHMVSGRGYRHS